MKPIYIHILMLGASVLTMLMGVFQIKRKDTDQVLMVLGTVEVSLGTVLLVTSIITWNSF